MPLPASLSSTEKRFLEKTLDDFRRHGAELGPDDKAKLQAIEVELTQLTTEFAQHVLDETNAFELILADEGQLAGLPESARQAAAESAKAKGVEGWRFTLQAPSLIPLLALQTWQEIGTSDFPARAAANFSLTGGRVEGWNNTRRKSAAVEGSSGTISAAATGVDRFWL